MKFKVHAAIMVAGATGLAAAPASAGWLYSYTGKPFTDVTSACCGPDTPFTTSDYISFHFTSPDLLAPNLNDAGFSAPITGWALSVGPLSYNNTDGVLYSINFSTNAFGNITGYQFTTQTNVVAPNLLPAEYPPTPYEEEVFSFDLPAPLGMEDGIYIPSIFQDSSYASNTGSPGAWTISSVPEPGAWALMLIGVGCVGAALRRRERASTVVR